MKARFSFGKGGLDAAIPEGFRAQVIHSKTGAPLEDEAEALGRALDDPIGCAPLAEIGSGCAVASRFLRILVPANLKKSSAPPLTLPSGGWRLRNS